MLFLRVCELFLIGIACVHSYTYKLSVKIGDCKACPSSTPDLKVTFIDASGQEKEAGLLLGAPGFEKGKTYTLSPITTPYAMHSFKIETRSTNMVGLEEIHLFESDLFVFKYEGSPFYLDSREMESATFSIPVFPTDPVRQETYMVEYLVGDCDDCGASNTSHFILDVFSMDGKSRTACTVYNAYEKGSIGKCFFNGRPGEKIIGFGFSWSEETEKAGFEKMVVSYSGGTLIAFEIELDDNDTKTFESAIWPGFDMFFDIPALPCQLTRYTVEFRVAGTQYADSTKSEFVQVTLDDDESAHLCKIFRQESFEKNKVYSCSFWMDSQRPINEISLWANSADGLGVDRVTIFKASAKVYEWYSDEKSGSSMGPIYLKTGIADLQTFTWPLELPKPDLSKYFLHADVDAVTPSNASYFVTVHIAENKYASSSAGPIRVFINEKDGAKNVSACIIEKRDDKYEQGKNYTCNKAFQAPNGQVLEDFFLAVDSSSDGIGLAQVIVEWSYEPQLAPVHTYLKWSASDTSASSWNAMWLKGAHVEHQHFRVDFS